MTATPQQPRLTFPPLSRPADQIIATDPTNLLIRSLNIQRKQREDAARAARSAGGAAASAPAKRPGTTPDRDAPPSKRAAPGASGSGIAAGAGASTAPATEAELKGMTKVALVARARAVGVPSSGVTKPVLVARLLAHQRGGGGGA